MCIRDRVYADWKVGDVDDDPEIKYVKFQKEGGTYGYGYAAVVYIPETASAKDFDLAGTLALSLIHIYGHRQDITDDRDQVGLPHGDSPGHSQRDSAPKLDDGHHRKKE